MREYFFDPEGDLPIVKAQLAGVRGVKNVRLVLDTGAGITQVHTATMEFLGQRAFNESRHISIHGVTGPAEDGYVCTIESLRVLGTNFNHIPVAAFDFSNWEEEGIDGLLGWDMIRLLHLEMDGPKGKLIVFD